MNSKVAQMNCRLGDVERNLRKIKAFAEGHGTA